MSQPSTTTIRIGAGSLYVNNLGGIEPTTASSALDAGWLPLGYTDAGSTFTYTPTITEQYVAELYEPVLNQVTQVISKVSFALAEDTYVNMALALNGGLQTPAGAPSTFEPPDPGAEVRIALLWQSFDTQKRLLFRRCLQTGAVAMGNMKAAKTVYPVEYTLERPSPAVKAWKAYWIGASTAN